MPTLRRRLGTMMLGVFVAVIGVLLLQPAPPAHAAVDRTAEQDLVCSLNEARVDAGLAPLRVNAELTRVSRAHSVVMADDSHLHHNPNLANDVTDWRLVAENVGRGPSADSLHRALMNSAGHRANILNTRVTEVGVGVEVRGSQLWITQVFRQPTGSVQGTVPSCGSATTVAAEPVPGPTIPVRGDWNGDGRSTPGRFVDGSWELSNTPSGSADIVVEFGARGDHPVTGDWNGDGRTTIGVVRNDTWLLRDRLTAGRADHTFRYGQITRGDVPITGDWDGNGRTTIGIIRDGQWHLRDSLSSGPGETVFTYGRITRGDVPLVGDWNRDGHDTIGIVRDGQWHLRNTLSGGPGQVVFTYGRVLRGDVPIIGDWDRSGIDGIGIVRGREWHLRNTLSGGGAEVRFDW